MGLSKGSVIFVRVNHIEHIYARFSVHKQQIDHILEFKKEKCILTLCQENLLQIWGFVDRHMQIWRKFNLMRPVTTMKVVDSPTLLLMTFESGESYYFAWAEQNKNLQIVLREEEEFYRKANAVAEEPKTCP